MECLQSICVSTRLFRWRVGTAMAFESIVGKSASQARSVGEIDREILTHGYTAAGEPALVGRTRGRGSRSNGVPC